MDLFAFAQIDSLEKIASENGISVPRLRGYRLMKDEEPIPENEMQMIGSWFYEDLIHSVPMFDSNPSAFEYGPEYLDRAEKYYLIFDSNGDAVGINLKRLSPKIRKRVKTNIRNQINKQKKQWKTFNKYVGREDILFIHARVGGANWKYYECEQLISEPWFIEKVNDSFDCTYCDIYARIKPRKEGTE